MPVERTSGTTSLLDVLDRVLDRGIHLDTEERVALLALSLASGEARLVVTESPHSQPPEDARVAGAKGG